VPGEEAGVLVERGFDLSPRRPPGEDEVVQTAEEPQREVPPEIGCDPADTLVAGEPAAERCVER
jgi:hypothetical protein